MTKYNSDHDTMVRTNIFLTHEQREELKYAAETLATGRPYNTMAAQARLAVEEYIAEVIHGTSVRVDISLEDYQYLTNIVNQTSEVDAIMEVRALLSNEVKNFVAVTRLKDLEG